MLQDAARRACGHFGPLACRTVWVLWFMREQMANRHSAFSEGRAFCKLLFLVSVGDKLFPFVGRWLPSRRGGNGRWLPSRSIVPSGWLSSTQGSLARTGGTSSCAWEGWAGIIWPSDCRLRWLSSSSLACSIFLRSVFEVRDVVPDSEEMLATLLVDEVWGRPRIPDETVTFINAPFSYGENRRCAVKHKW